MTKKQLVAILEQFSDDQEVLLTQMNQLTDITNVTTLNATDRSVEHTFIVLS